MSNDNSVEGALSVIEELRLDAKAGKGKHFAASDRKLMWHRLCGIPVILANLFVGIVLLNLQGQAAAPSNLPQVSASVGVNPVQSQLPLSEEKTSIRTILTSDGLALLSVVLAFSAASLSAVQTFFNFYKSFEGHRAIGNRYTHLSRQCKMLQQKHRDIPFEAQVLWELYEKLLCEYNEINIDGESFPTSPKDLKKSQSAPKVSPYEPPKNAV